MHQENGIPFAERFDVQADPIAKGDEGRESAY